MHKALTPWFAIGTRVRCLCLPSSLTARVKKLCGCDQQELRSRQDLESFVQSQPDTVLTVVNVSSSSATSCVRVFAAVIALAKSFTGYAAFGRLLYDTSDENLELARELKVVEVRVADLFHQPSKESHGYGVHLRCTTGQQLQSCAVNHLNALLPGRCRGAELTEGFIPCRYRGPACWWKA